MKILHVLDHSIPAHSGYAFRTRSILVQQRALGWETDHVTGSKHPDPVGAEETVEGFHFFRTAPSTGWTASLPVLRQLDVIKTLTRRLREVIAQVRPDVLHAHSPSLNGAAAIKAAKAFGLPVVYEVRAFWEDAAVDLGTSRPGGLRYRLTRNLETKVVRGADAVTTICEGLRRDLVARGIDEDKVTVIPNAVDPERFSMDVARDDALARELGLDGKQVLGFLGSFYHYEGLSLLVEALPAMLDKRPDVRLLLVGGGNEDAALKQQVQAAGLSDHVVFTGRVPHEDVDRYYGLVDFCVYPRVSLRVTELVTPLKPLEAMAQGKLCVASDVGGHKELIRHGETGMLFRAGDAGSLAGTVLALLDDDELQASMRVAGREFVETERSWRASVSRYRDVYERLVKASAR